jgi:hypothetical protein
MGYVMIEGPPSPSKSVLFVHSRENVENGGLLVFVVVLLFQLLASFFWRTPLICYERFPLMMSIVSEEN